MNVTTETLRKAGALSLASAALLGWPIALSQTSPSAIKKLGIVAPRRIMQLHLDQVMMGLVLLATASNFPTLPGNVAGPLLVGTILNPLGFVPMMFVVDADKTLLYRGLIGVPFLASTLGFVGVGWFAVFGRSPYWW